MKHLPVVQTNWHTFLIHHVEIEGVVDSVQIIHRRDHFISDSGPSWEALRNRECVGLHV